MLEAGGAGAVFSLRPVDWVLSCLPRFDAAFTMSVRPDRAGIGGTPRGGSSAVFFDEKQVREAFMHFLVATMKTYRKYLVYGSAGDPLHLVKFKFDPFVQGKQVGRVIIYDVLTGCVATCVAVAAGGGAAGVVAAGAGGGRRRACGLGRLPGPALPHAGLLAVRRRARIVQLGRPRWALIAG